jgi:hypothetical protein
MWSEAAASPLAVRPSAPSGFGEVHRAGRVDHGSCQYLLLATVRALRPQQKWRLVAAGRLHLVVRAASDGRNKRSQGE